uniref:Ig-like domain-containing protein n=1 Tax=Glossina palpalis gambiensis TaxID=67801 RepID=A0A1B0B5M4_9MUSC
MPCFTRYIYVLYFPFIFYLQPVGIYAKKYEWAARPSTPSGGSLHLDLHPPPMQIGGDCSLWIRSATLDFDDGLWECQVTASDFTTQDALTSQPVRLVVRVGHVSTIRPPPGNHVQPSAALRRKPSKPKLPMAPQRPRLEYEGTHVPPGHNITVDSGSLATAKCVSHYGNPPATLKWFLGDQEIEPIHLQANITEPDNPRTWSATSVVQLTAMRERHGDILRCLAFHESYTAKSVPVEARLDIKYAPTIRLIGSPEIDLEEDKDALVLRCVADANPPASIVWRRAGRSEIASLQETLQLRPVGRRDAGLYTCQAQNSVGTSEQLSVQLDVKYPPKILSAGPDRLTTAPLFSPAAFECVADGNPMPTYKWVQRISHGSKYVERGHESRLVVDNVTYDYQGEYECRATNYINGQERVAISEPVSLQVVGAPQILRLHPSMHTVLTRRGDAATLTFIVCADPRPQRIAWEWGSLRLDAGSATDRFRADDLLQDAREDCYLSTLHIHHTNEHDARPYYLVVENERGSDRHAIQLNVEGTFSGADKIKSFSSYHMCVMYVCMHRVT